VTMSNSVTRERRGAFYCVTVGEKGQS